MKKIKYLLYITVIFTSMFIFSIHISSQDIEEKSLKTQDVDKTSFNPLEESNVWIIKNLNKYDNTLKYNIFLDFKNITYYNLRKKIITNIINNYSIIYDTLLKKDETITFNESYDFKEFQKNNKIITFSNINEFNKASLNIQNLINFLLKHPVYKNDGLKKSYLPWPLTGRVISFFGKQDKKQYKASIIEKGIRIKANFGEEVKAVEKGVVLYADWLYGFGKVIIIDHGESFFTVYGYLSEILIEKNIYIDKNQIIGKVGDSGTGTGACLYFEIREKGEALNPIDWLENKKE
ncbi:MAG: peptidoglycan DD-metalloendopeptidase family protein [Candidatus Firestonebacteria bacterium]|nr:peptidoglycan DD-metalloendopeptidase family protein [Candidatus Firestonebacteria bacterium]